MSIDLEELAADILGRRISRQEASRRFVDLSSAEKNLLMSRLKGKLPATERGARSDVGNNVRLTCVDERQLDEQHLRFIRSLAERYAKFAPKSKENALKHQDYLVDARKIANLKKPIKQLQFHITYDRAEGPYLYDIDGNRYIDITGDNGVNIFGGRPDFIGKAIAKRIERGYPLVGYTEELFEAARLFCELTGHERVAFTQSGTEAVMWAVRLARAATQRAKIVIFEGSYHGMSDTVAASKDHEGKSVSAGLGIPQEYAEQLIVLDYGNMAHLDVIENLAGEIAGVLVEPVQASQPHIQPREFLRELRALTQARGMLLIFDEMITGFRACPRGAQGHFGVKADIATYGKIPGGGMPTGMIAGAARYMDLIDGGKWQFEDDSMPKLKRIYIGGTHTRNPLKLAASLEALTEIKKRCPGQLECRTCSCFQKDLSARTRGMAERLNAFFQERQVPVRVDYFSSLFKFRFLDSPYGVVRELFLVLLRMQRVETSVSGNFFLTAAHDDTHVDSIVEAVKDSIDSLLKAGFFVPADPVEVAAEDELAQETFSPAGDHVQSRLKIRAGEREVEKLKALIKSDWQRFQEGAH